MPNLLQRSYMGYTQKYAKGAIELKLLNILKYDPQTSQSDNSQSKQPALPPSKLNSITLYFSQFYNK